MEIFRGGSGLQGLHSKPVNAVNFCNYTNAKGDRGMDDKTTRPSRISDRESRSWQ